MSMLSFVLICVQQHQVLTCSLRFYIWFDLLLHYRTTYLCVSPSMPSLAVHKDLASLAVPLLDESYAAVVVRQFGFLVVLLQRPSQQNDSTMKTPSAYYKTIDK